MVKSLKERHADHRAVKTAIIGGVDHQRCNGCDKMIPLDTFATSTRDPTKRIKRCPPCAQWYSDYQKNKRKTDPMFVAMMSATNHSAAGKKRTAKYQKSEKGKETAKRSHDARVIRMRTDPNVAKSRSLMKAAQRVVNSPTSKSPLLVRETAFASEAAFRQNLSDKFAGEMTWANHGDKWEVEHIIPRQAYDHTNPNDVKRCWCAANIRPLAPAENIEKSFKIIDSLCDQVGVANFPLAWNGRIPDEAEKSAFYKACVGVLRAGFE